MKLSTLSVLILSLLMTFSALSQDAGLPDKFSPLSTGLVALDSQEGRRLLKESDAQEAFWQLAQFYAPQPDLGSCSVASCNMVLNALPIPRPDAGPYGSYRLFTSDNLFSTGVNRIVTRQKVSASGMTLDELRRVLETFPVTVKMQYANEGDVNAFRTVLQSSLRKRNQFVVVNYLRAAIHQQTGGHISPLGAYHQAEDMVLILDTANYKYPWTWVKTGSLWEAMAKGLDDSSGRSRGWIQVGAK